MSQQYNSGPQTDGPVSPPRYGKTVLKVAALFLPLCAGVGYWIGSKSEAAKKPQTREVTVASKTAKPERASVPTAVTPQPEPAVPKKVETPPKPPMKKAEMPPDEMPEPKTVAAKTPAKTEPDPEPKPEPKPEAKPEPKPEPKPKTPEPKPEPKKEAAPTFASLMPLFQMHCASCHGPASKKGGLDMATLAAVMKGGNNGKVVVAGDLENSNLWTQIEGDSMPPDGKKKLTDAEKKRIQAWILGGAK